MRLDFDGNPFIGVFVACTENHAIVSPFIRNYEEKISSVLKVDIIPTMLGGCSAVGSLASGNSSGFIVSRFAFSKEVRKIKSSGSKVAKLRGLLNAAGNLILANDTAALVHPELSDKAVEIIEKTLCVEVERGTIGESGNVGMAGIATNKGLLVSPRITEEEFSAVEELFSLPVDTGTVNSGFPWVKSALLANSKGYIAGTQTSGPELGRIEDALGFL